MRVESLLFMISSCGFHHSTPLIKFDRSEYLKVEKLRIRLVILFLTLLYQLIVFAQLNTITSLLVRQKF